MSLWLNFLICYIKCVIFNEGQKFNPFSCSIFSYFKVFRTEAKNGTSRFPNFRCWTLILKWDTFMNLWLNFLICYIKIFMFNESQKFNPFSCSIFSYFQGFQNRSQKRHFEIP